MNEPPSSLQRNVTPDSVSVKLKLGAVVFDGFVGLAVIEGAGGGIRSTVHVNEVAGPMLPAGPWPRP